MISPGTCFIFKILVFQAVRGTKGQKMAQNDKNSVCHTSYLRNHNCLLWYTCVKWLYISRIFFYFLKMLIFWVAIGVKGQKMTQHEKKLCLLYSIYQEPYIIWLSFVVHMFKMIISLVVFFQIFKILIFQVIRRVKEQNIGVKGQKITLNDKKSCVSFHISGSIRYMIVSFVALV